MDALQVVTPWYQTSLFGVIIGAVIAGIISIIIFILTNKYNDKKYKKDIIVMLIHSNSKLFSTIYKGAINREKIDYISLREELMSSSIIFLLPSEIRTLFSTLYEIHTMNPAEYSINKNRIFTCLVEIKNKIEEYEVDIFGNK